MHGRLRVDHRPLIKPVLRSGSLSISRNRTRLPKARLPRITRVLPDKTCRAVSSAVYAPVKPVQKMDAPAISHIEQRLAAQHIQQTPLLPIQHKESRLILDKNLVLLDDLHSSATVTTHESGGTVVSLEVYNGAVASHDFALGKLLSQRFLACARCKLWWMTPEWGTSAAHLPPETQFMLVELKEGGPYAVLLPLIDSNKFRATLRPPKKDNGLPFDEALLYLRMESGDPTVQASVWKNSLYIAAGQDPFVLVEKAVEAAASLSGGALPRHEKKQPDSLNWFGWCTWDAYYSKVSARGLHEGMKTLSDGGVPPKFLIIDDGWQCTDVDVPLRKPMTSRMMMLKEMEESMNATQDEFIDAELEILARSARNLPPSSSAGSALQALSADEEVEEKEFEGSRRLKSSLKIKSKPKMKHQMGTYPRGRKLQMGKNPPASNEAQLLSASQFNGTSFADVADHIASDEFTTPETPERAKNGSSAEEGVFRPSEGSVLAPSEAQQASSSKTKAESVRQSNANGNGSNGGSASLTLGGRATSQQNGVEAKGQSEPDASNPLASRDAGEQAAVRVSEPVPEEPEGKGLSLMWLVSALTQRLLGGLIGLFEAAFLKFYQYVVDPAAPGSWPIRFFTWAATGPIKQNLLEFYAASGDFTRRLTSVKANGKFSSLKAGPQDYWTDEPERLGEVVASLQAMWGLKHIYCWHGLAAYWSGVATGKDEAGVAKYDARITYATPTPGLAEVEPSMNWNPSVVAGIGVVADPATLYNDMHSYLAESGITGVKVDCQAGVGLIGSAMGGGPAVAQQYHIALEDSIKKHFPGNDCINCMCHSTENFYRFSETAVARVSDDFYPRDPASSHPHVAACAYNSMLMGALIQPDWDMFHSKHPAAQLHAAARAVSGASVYVSDYPGKHDFSILKQLVLADGSVHRALLPGKPTLDSLFVDPLRDNKSLLKVWNVNRYNGMVGVFNLQGSSWSRTRRQFLIHDDAPPSLTTAVKPADIPLLSSSPHTSLPHSSTQAGVNGRAAVQERAAEGQEGEPKQFVAFCNATQQLICLGWREGIDVALAGGESAVVTIAPMLRSAQIAVAVIGLSNLLNCGGAIVSCELLSAHDTSKRKTDSTSHCSNGKSPICRLQLLVKGHGKLLLYSSQPPSVVSVGGEKVVHTHEFDSGELALTLAGDAEELHHEVVIEW